MAAVAAVAAESGPAPRKLYWTTVPRSAMLEMGRVMRELGADWDEPEEADGAVAEDGGGSPEPEIGLPDDEITTWVDVKDFGAQKFDALGQHASQSENIFFLKMGQELFTELMGVETFLRVQDETGAGLPEHDLFAGLR
jgi:hypothetical protein